jgi:uncharacterized protein (TIGR02145 family)
MCKKSSFITVLFLFLYSISLCLAQEISFKEHNIASSFSGGRDVYVKDINKDGFIDIVAGGGSEVSWWENNGNKNFTKHVISTNVGIARSVRAEDIDGDGEIDILAAVWQTNSIIWWKNDGKEIFIEVIIDSNFIGPHTVDIKDVNGDGNMDILCSGFNLSGNSSEIAWWENHGYNNFTKHVISERFQRSSFIFGEFIDDDEHLDILACGEHTNEIVWWRNDGETNFSGNEHIIDSAYTAAHTVFAKDLDLDNDMDILGTACMSSQFTWWENDGNENFQKHPIAFFNGALWIDAVDLDADGDRDLIGAAMGTSNIAWWENDGNQNFTKHTIKGNLTEAYCVVFADMDNDSDYDLVAIGKGSNKINWYENDKSQTVTDFDGNVYNTVVIGEQTWLKEDIKSLHYSDGTEIPDAVAYNNDDSLANIYGRLYTWDAAMRNSTEEGAQGVCPCGWHIPSDDDWKELENYLGGAAAAGGKMKESGAAHWKSPNTGADNSSGLTILPGGEYDAYYSPPKFNLLSEYAIFWTSTQVSATKARERYLSYNDAKSSIYDWYKVMKYSIRCVKDTTSTALRNKDNKFPTSFSLEQNYPNPFNSSTNIEYSLAKPSNVHIIVYNLLGQEVRTLVNEQKNIGKYRVIWDGKDEHGNISNSGIYYFRMYAGNETHCKKMVYLK